MQKKPVSLLTLSAILFLCPLSAGAEISFSTQAYPDPALNPAPSAAVSEIVKKAINRLAADPDLSRLPIRQYFNRSDLHAKIIFDNPGAADGAKTINHNEIHIRSDGDYAYYLSNLIHEFVHVTVAEKYGDTLNYTFLQPADYAFLNLMEEAFANSVTLWLHLSYPEMPSNRKIRYWNRQTVYTDIADAMRNDLQTLYPNYTETQIKDRVLGEMFHQYMTSINTYTMHEIPGNMAIAYGKKNTFLIPEYNAYRIHSDTFMRHVWNFLFSIMPPISLQFPHYMSYNFYNGKFAQYVFNWASSSRKWDGTILYWTQFDAAAAARAALAQKKEADRSYDYLPRQDEERLNRVMKEIDSGFVPVDTSKRRPR